MVARPLSSHLVSALSNTHETMKNKENKTRPSMLTRSLSHAFGGSRHNAIPHAPGPLPQFHGLPPVFPACAYYHACGHTHPISCHDASKMRCCSPSLRSTAATVSDTKEARSILSMGSSSASAATSSHYSGFNSAIYGTSLHNAVETSDQIHKLLDASSASLIWDVRTEPKELQLSRSASPVIGPHVLSFPLTQTAVGHIRIVSPDFPWEIIIGPKQYAITCSEILHALYGLLSGELEDVAWGLADEKKRSSLVRAWKKRSDLDPRIRRVDWLGRRYMFKGLYRDAKFVQQNVRPDVADVAETLIVTFHKA